MDWTNRLNRQTIFGLFFIFLIFAATFRDSVLVVWERWLKFDEAYSHGLLVFGISLFLVYRAIRAMGALHLNPSPVGILLLLMASLLWALGAALNIQVIQVFLLPGILWLSFLALFGWRQATPLIVPMGFLYFAIPFWDFLSMPLQLLTVAVNDLWLRAFGITAIIEDVFVELPGLGVFEVAHGCSGLRYLVVSLTLTTLYGWLHFNGWFKRILLMAMGVALALAANWIRVFVIIYAGYTTNMQTPLIKDHDIFGWLVFAGTLIPLFWLANRMARGEKAAVTAASRTGVRPASRWRSILALLALVLAVILPTRMVLGQMDGAFDYYAPLRLPGQLHDWSAIPVQSGDTWRPDLRGYTQKAEIRYFRQDRRVLTVNLYLYSHQSPGRELIQDKNRLYDPHVWRLLEKGLLGMEAEQPYNQYLFEHKGTGERYLAVQGYYVAGSLHTDPIRAKMAQALGYLRGRHDASLLAVSVPCQDSCDAEREILREFLSLNDAVLKASIDEAYFETRNRAL